MADKKEGVVASINRWGTGFRLEDSEDTWYKIGSEPQEFDKGDRISFVPNVSEKDGKKTIYANYIKHVKDSGTPMQQKADAKSDNITRIAVAKSLLDYYGAMKLKLDASFAEDFSAVYGLIVGEPQSTKQVNTEADDPDDWVDNEFPG